MLNERAQILLKTLVERYISDGQPVGSRALQQFSGLEVSPATIRNVMADLEGIGLVSSPHTSAGRVPTGMAYRLFIDTMLVTKPLDSMRVQQMEHQLQPANPSRLIAQGIVSRKFPLAGQSVKIACQPASFLPRLQIFKLLNGCHTQSYTLNLEL